ncbi:hypothetical protein B0H10DRAFT_1955902 [Mycena sp. CBHHK59/15]|nr:hypothetical protein B0H10DRAFT_1955902 [Mycena sp. CBHHK59/15]
MSVASMPVLAVPSQRPEKKKKKVAVYQTLHETHTMKVHHAVHIISEHGDRHSPHAHNMPVWCPHEVLYTYTGASSKKPTRPGAEAAVGRRSVSGRKRRDELTVEWMKGMEVWTWGMWNCECMPRFLVSKMPVQVYILGPDAPANGPQNDPARSSPSTCPSGTVPAAEIIGGDRCTFGNNQDEVRGKRSVMMRGIQETRGSTGIRRRSSGTPRTLQTPTRPWAKEDFPNQSSSKGTSGAQAVKWKLWYKIHLRQSLRMKVRHEIVPRKRGARRHTVGSSQHFPYA